MLPSLWLNSASSTPSELVVREGEQVLGRSADADICLDETFVSGYHARLNWHNERLTVLDLDSTNGTIVNGVPVVGWTSLTDGDIIEFGGVGATVRLPLSDEPNPVLGPPTPPPPPGPSSQRPKPVDVESRAKKAATTEQYDRADRVDDARSTPGRVFGSRLGPSVSDRTEPTFEQPLGSALTVPPTPPTGISITETNAEAEHGRSKSDDRLRTIIGAAAVVLVILLAVTAVIVYLIR